MKQFLIIISFALISVASNATGTQVVTQSQPETRQPVVQNQERRPETVVENRYNTSDQNRYTPVVYGEKEVKNTKLLNWGIKAGLNSALEMTNNNESTGARNGLHIGFFMETPISEKVDIQPELVYSMQGCENPDGSVEKIDYINLPVIFKIYTNKSRTFSIDLGPQIGYCISAKWGNVDLYNMVNKIDAALCVGISYKITPNFSIGLRGNGSVTKLVNYSTHRNSVGQLGASYLF